MKIDSILKTVSARSRILKTVSARSALKNTRLLLKFENKFY